MDEPLADPPLPPEAAPHLRYLKTLVTVLAAVMTLGILAIVALLWLRLAPGPGVTMPELPENMALPQGARPAAVTFARDWTVVVTEAGEVLVFDRGGALRQNLELAD